MIKGNLPLVEMSPQGFQQGCSYLHARYARAYQKKSRSKKISMCNQMVTGEIRE